MTTFPIPRLNAAVMTMANKVCPAGWDVGPSVPQSLEQLQDHLAKTGRIMVWDGASDNTIYGCPEHNYAFRAWHDWTHLMLRAEFSLDGELAVAHRQIEDLCRIFGHNDTTKKWGRIIMIEVYDQARYQAIHGYYPVDQVAFTEEALRV